MFLYALGWIFKIKLYIWELYKRHKKEWNFDYYLTIQIVTLVRNSYLIRYKPKSHGCLNITSQYTNIQELIEDLVVLNKIIENKIYLDQKLIQNLDRSFVDNTLYNFMVDFENRSVSPSVAIEEIYRLLNHNYLLLSSLKKDKVYDYYSKKIYNLYINIYHLTETLAKINWS